MDNWLQKIQDLWLDHRSLVLTGVGLIAIVGAFFWHWPGGQSVPTASSATSSRVQASRSATGAVWIDVKGAVMRPGVYHLGRGDRVQEALGAAGGQLPTADLNQVNLAKELHDQEVVYVPQKGERPPAGLATGVASNGGATSASGDQERINLNQASKDDLMKIDGVGDKKADKIIAYRQEHGDFRQVEDLKNVAGFGDKTVARLKDRLAV